MTKIPIDPDEFAALCYTTTKFVVDRILKDDIEFNIAVVGKPAVAAVIITSIEPRLDAVQLAYRLREELMAMVKAIMSDHDFEKSTPVRLGSEDLLYPNRPPAAPGNN